MQSGIPYDDGIGEISEKLGTMILKICTRFSMHPRFYGYSFRDEFVAEAICRCLTNAIDRINLDHPKCNVFAYLTQTAYNVFRQKIKSEKKYANTKTQLRTEMYSEFENSEGLDQTQDNPEEDD